MANKKLKVGNVPNLRFPGFEGEWTTKKLGDVTDKINSGKTPLGGESAYTDRGVLFIRSQNVSDNQLELKHSVFIPEEVNSQMRNSIVQPNDILLNITGASLGRSCVVPHNFEVGNVSQHVCIVRLDKEHVPRFIQPFFSSIKGQNIFKSLQTGSGREGLNFENIRNVKLNFPAIAEQQKIASFFSLINERIQTQNKIIKQLETLIQNFRNDIFQRKLRFKNEIGGDFSEWIDVKIGDILKIGSGKDYKHLRPGNIPVFGTGGFMTSVDDYLHNGETVCIGRKGTIDKPMYYDGKIWTVDTLFYTHSFQSCIPKFIFHLFKTINWLEFNEASGVPSLSKSTIEKLKVQIPSLNEQNIISNFLFRIDQKIQTEKHILRQLEKQKKTLLKQLFI
ncbi:restriction endonuclease subunit S [Parapedobacter koreensis]|uniref:Type I restriction enzyme, S subunit n=1 Tax=Parapedobacter koreensis TaxID=332977 RepID=A0A1H7TZE0_9SPHI|nr:restriction endonuclease subunit S [Parapedobacter koreensis]SEL89337.1 type I restriction enzyme, S subunit [Parapedobacter koreensis]